MTYTNTKQIAELQKQFLCVWMMDIKADLNSAEAVAVFIESTDLGPKTWLTSFCIDKKFKAESRNPRIVSGK